MAARKDKLGKTIGRGLVAIMLVAGLSQAAGAATIQAAHRAVYDLALARSTQKAGVDSVDGRLVFEVNGSACEGYTVNSRLVNRYSYKEGNSRLIDLQSSTYESGDGKTFDYQEKEYIDAKLNSDKRTSVKRPAANSEAEGQLRTPDSKDFKLAADILFPIQHQLQIVDAAKAGQTRFAANVFDGSDNENAAQVIATIGKRIEPGTSTDKAEPSAVALKGLAAWPVSLAYFALQGEQDVPTFQTSFLLYEDGVSTNLALDYGDMTLSGKLVKLEMLGDAPSCP